MGLPLTSAHAATTYNVQVGADFFNPGSSKPVPGFSLRIYPGSITVHKGDTIHYAGFGPPTLLTTGEHPAEWFERNGTFVGDPFFPVALDSDDGQGQIKSNETSFTPNADCSQASAPCEWNGNGQADDYLNPGPAFDEETFTANTFVTITANPGDVLYAFFAPGAYQRIQVVADGDPASSQSDLDARAAKMLEHDFDDLAAIHFAMINERSFHVRNNGSKVWDAWSGIDVGPMGLDVMYPKKLKVAKGDTVQWHFPYTFNNHSVSMPQAQWVEHIAEPYEDPTSGFGPQCDPDGDGGAGPDVPPTGFDPATETPICPEGATPELDFNPAELFPFGDGTYTGGTDFEHSGVRGAEFLQGEGLESFTTFSEDPYNLKFTKSSNKKGYKYLCTIHGPFMSGRIVVGK